MRILVTRVQPQAQRWVELLRARGHEAFALPLIEVRGVPDPSGLRAAWQNLSDYQAVMFVSAHAVAHFFGCQPAPVPNVLTTLVVSTRCWAPGPGTAQALQDQGVPAQCVDAPAAQAGQFDSEALWQQVQAQIRPGAKVLIVRGDRLDAAGRSLADGDPGVGRDWLAQRLRQAGAQVDFVVAYQRGAPHWTAEQLALARCGARDGSVWLFSSSEALDYLRAMLPAQDWTAARALATHERIGAAACALGFAVVLARPTLSDVLASIESWHER